MANDIVVGVSLEGDADTKARIKSVGAAIEGISGAVKSLETKSASGQKTLGYFKSLQTEITETKKQLRELKKSGALDPSFNFDRTIKDLNSYNRKLDQSISKRTLAITGKKAEGLTPVFAEVAKNLTEVNAKIKESTQLQKDATNAFAQMGKIRRQTTEDERKGYNKYLEDTFKGYHKQRDEFVKNVKTQYSQSARETEKYAKNTENILSPFTKKTSLLQSFSVLGGAKFKTSDVDTQVKTVDTAMSQLGLRISTLRQGMAEAFAKGRIADVSKEMSVLKAHVNEVQGALRTQPLLKTEDSIGRLGLLQDKLKEVTKDYNTFSKPPVAKQAKKTLGIDEVSSSLRTLQMKLSETAHTFNQFKTKKTPLLDLQASILVSRTELDNFIKQAKAGGLTDAFAKDIAGARNELKKLDMELKKTLAPTSQKIRIGRGSIDLSGLNTASQKLREVNQHLFDLGTGLQYIGRTGLMYVSAPLIAMGTFALRSFANLEQANSAFKALTGSAIEGTQVFKELVSFSLRSPVDLKQLMAGTQQLLALGFTAKEVVPMMKVLSEAVAATGASADTLQRVTLALSQVKGRAKLVGDEIRQLGQVGLPVIQILAKKMGKTEAEFYETMKKSIINGTDAINAIIVGLHEKYAGYLELKAKTLSGSWQILSNNISVTLAKLGERLNTAFTIPETLLSISKYIEGLGNAIVAFPSLTKMIADFTGLVTVLFSVIAALGIIAKIFSYWKGYQGLLLEIGISGGTLGIILGIAAGVYLIYVYLNNIKLLGLEIELAIMDWGAPFDTIITNLNEIYELYVRIKDFTSPTKFFQQGMRTSSWLNKNLPGAGTRMVDSILGIEPTVPDIPAPLKKIPGKLSPENAKTRKQLEDQIKVLRDVVDKAAGEGLLANLGNFKEEFNSILDEMAKGVIRVTDNAKDLGRTIKDITDDLQRAQAANQLMFGVSPEFNKWRADLQDAEQAINSLAKSGLEGAQEVMEKIAKTIPDLKIKADVFDIMEKYNVVLKENAAHFDLWGNSAKDAENKMKNLSRTIEDLSALPSPPIDEINKLKVLLEDIQKPLNFEMLEQIETLKTSTRSLGGDIGILLKQFNAENVELLKTGTNYEILTEMLKFFKKEHKDLTGSFSESTEKLKDVSFLAEAWGINVEKALGNYDPKNIKSVEEAIKTLTDSIGQRQELMKTAVKGTADAIKNIWNQTEMSFKDVWHGALDTFVDVMSQMIIKEIELTMIHNANEAARVAASAAAGGAQVAIARASTLAIGAEMAVATAGITLVLGMLAMAFGGKKTVKVEPLTDRLKKVFEDFIVDFKGAMGDFKERLFPASGEAKKEMSQTQRVLEGLNILRDALTVIPGSGSGENEIFDTIKGLTRKTFNEINKILKETTGGSFKFISQTKEGINQRIIDLTKKLSENLVDITTLMVDRFEKIRDIVQKIFDIEKDRASFIKDMTQTITDVTRTGKSTGELLGLQTTDATKLQGEVSVNDVNLATVKAQLVAAYDWKGLTEDAIALRKIDIDYLKKAQKDLFDLQIEKIGETKDAYMTFWDTVQTVVSETLDLIGQKADFIKEITGTIAEVQNYNKSSQVLFQQNIDSMTGLKESFDKATGTGKLSLGQQLKDSLMTTWESAKTFFSEITTKISDIISGKNTFTKGVADTIKGIETSTLAPAALLKLQQADVGVLQTQLGASGISPEDAMRIGEELKTALNIVWETGKGIFGDITNLESELTTLNESISKETNIAELAKLGQDKLAVQAKIDAIKNTSGLSDITTFQGQIVDQLKDLNAPNSPVITAYDKLIAETTTIKESMEALAGPGGWQQKIVDELKTLTQGSSGAYDALIASSASLLGINKTTGVTTGDVETALGAIKDTLLINLGSLQTSGTASFGDLISVELLALGELEVSNAYLNAIEKGIYGTLTILGEIGKNAAAATDGNIDTILSTLSKLFNVTKMAAGGIVNKPTLAMIGEAGPEAVIPLSKMGQSGNVNINIDGAMIMDEITMSKFARTIGSKIRTQQMRYV